MNRLQKTILGVGFSSAILVLLFPTYRIEGMHYSGVFASEDGTVPFQESRTPFKSRQRVFLFLGPQPQHDRYFAVDATGRPCTPHRFSGTEDLAVDLDVPQLGAELAAIAAVTSALLLICRGPLSRKGKPAAAQPIDPVEDA